MLDLTSTPPAPEPSPTPTPVEPTSFMPSDDTLLAPDAGIAIEPMAIAATPESLSTEALTAVEDMQVAQVPVASA